MKRAAWSLLVVIAFAALAAPWLAPNPPNRRFDDLLYAPLGCFQACSRHPKSVREFKPRKTGMWFAVPTDFPGLYKFVGSHCLLE